VLENTASGGVTQENVPVEVAIKGQYGSVTGVTFSGETLTLSPAKATGVKVTYKSSKKSGLYVDKAGKIVALKKGKYTVTIKAAGKKVKTKKITVRK
jgi:uncharacterized protein YjdB